MKKIKKLAPFILVTALAGSILVGCSSDGKSASANKSEDKVLQYQGSANSVSYPELAEDLG